MVALCGPPFEPNECEDTKFLSYKMAVDGHWVGALSVHPSCTQFTSDGSKFTLFYIMPTNYNSMAFELSFFI